MLDNAILISNWTLVASEGLGSLCPDLSGERSDRELRPLRSTSVSSAVGPRRYGPKVPLQALNRGRTMLNVVPLKRLQTEGLGANLGLSFSDRQESVRLR